VVEETGLIEEPSGRGAFNISRFEDNERFTGE
jgi:hypothetical protein